MKRPHDGARKRQDAINQKCTKTVKQTMFFLIFSHPDRTKYTPGTSRERRARRPNTASDGPGRHKMAILSTNTEPTSTGAAPRQCRLRQSRCRTVAASAPNRQVGVGTVPTRCRVGAESVPSRRRVGAGSVPSRCRVGAESVPIPYSGGRGGGGPRNSKLRFS